MSVVLDPRQPVDRPPLAAPRDALFYASPGRAQVRHIVAGTTAACGRAPLIVEEAVPAAEVPQGGRCQHPGCRKHWP